MKLKGSIATTLVASNLILGINLVEAKTFKSTSKTVNKEIFNVNGFSANLAAEGKFSDKCSQKYFNVLCAERKMNEYVDGELLLSAKSSQFKFMVSADAVQAIRPSIKVFGDSISILYKVSDNSAVGKMTYGSRSNSSASFSQQTLWMKSYTGSNINREGGAKLTISNLNSVFGGYVSNCGNHTLESYFESELMNRLMENRSNWYDFITLGGSKSFLKGTMTKFIDFCASSKSNYKSTILNNIQGANYHSVNLPAYKGSDSKSFTKTYNASYSKEFEFGFINLDTDLNIGFSTVASYQWSYDINPITLVNFTAYPKVYSDADVSVSTSGVTGQGNLSPLTEAFVTYNTYFNGKNVKIESKARVQKPKGTVDLCYSGLCIDLYDFDGGSTTYPLLNYSL